MEKNFLQAQAVGRKRSEMTRFRRAVGKTLAALGVAGLAVAGAAGIAVADPAGEGVAGEIAKDATGTITVHKHVKDEANSDPGDPAGAPLAGVEFTVQEVLYKGDPIDLSTAEGWEAAEGAYTLSPFPSGDYTLVSPGEKIVTGADGTAQTESLTQGLYYVTETGSGENLISSPAAPFLVTIPFPAKDGTWIYNVQAYPKNELGEVTPGKTVNDPEVEIGIGQAVTFDLSLPVAQSDLPYVSLSITDSLSDCLAFVSWTDVKIGDDVLTADDYTVSEDDSKITLTGDGLGKLNAQTKTAATTVTATLTATVQCLGINDNKVSAEINGKPGEGPEVSTNWAKLTVNKTGVNQAVLAGAKFELYDYTGDVGGTCSATTTGDTPIASGTTAADGTLSWEVWVGNNGDVTRVVCLLETEAPVGYVLPADPWTGPITLTAGNTEEASITTQSITNRKPSGPTLPETGASGTLLMTVGGLGLVALAGGLVLATRRKAIK